MHKMRFNVLLDRIVWLGACLSTGPCFAHYQSALGCCNALQLCVLFESWKPYSAHVMLLDSLLIRSGCQSKVADCRILAKLMGCAPARDLGYATVQGADRF